MTLRPKGQPKSRDQPSQQQCSSKWVEKQALKDNMKNSEIGGELVGVIAIGLIGLFFYTHQRQATGFLRLTLGGWIPSALWCYSDWSSKTPSKKLTGKRNKSLPPLIASVFWIVASAWFLTVVFPFDFAHFADIVPNFFTFLVSWITNDIARALIAIGMMGGIVFVGVNNVLCIKVKAFLLQQQKTDSSRLVQ